MNEKRNTEKQPERKRLQLDLSADALERLEELRRMSKANSNTDVVRNALRVYEWFLIQKNEDFKIQIAKGGEVRIVEFIF